jgi:hypothetical protein
MHTNAPRGTLSVTSITPPAFCCSAPPGAAAAPPPPSPPSPSAAATSAVAPASSSSSSSGATAPSLAPFFAARARVFASAFAFFACAFAFATTSSSDSTRAQSSSAPSMTTTGCAAAEGVAYTRQYPLRASPCGSADSSPSSITWRAGISGREMNSEMRLIPVTVCANMDSARGSCEE